MFFYAFLSFHKKLFRFPVDGNELIAKYRHNICVTIVFNKNPLSRTNSTLACQRYQNSWKTDCLVEIHYQQNITEEFSAKIVQNPATWYSQRMSSRCWLSFKNNFTCRRLNWSALIQLSLKVLNIYPRRGKKKSFFFESFMYLNYGKSLRKRGTICLMRNVRSPQN